jgi:hypothetical protein
MRGRLSGRPLLVIGVALVTVSKRLVTQWFSTRFCSAPFLPAARFFMIFTGTGRIVSSMSAPGCSLASHGDRSVIGLWSGLRSSASISELDAHRVAVVVAGLVFASLANRWPRRDWQENELIEGTLNRLL